MKIVSWNVNGIRAVIKKGFFDFIEKEKPDILCIQETKAHLSQIESELIKLGDYNYVLSEAEKKGYSGTAIFYNNSIKTLSAKNEIGIKEFDNEGRASILELKDYIIYNIYFPSGTTGDSRQDFKYDFLDLTTDYFKDIEEKKFKKLILLGDFNICHQNIDIHHPEVARKKNMSGFQLKECEWFSDFLNLGFTDSFRYLNPSSKEFSWWSYRANSRSKNLGWRIDYILLNKLLSNRLKRAEILDSVTGSDHCPILIEI